MDCLLSLISYFSNEIRIIKNNKIGGKFKITSSGIEGMGNNNSKECLIIESSIRGTSMSGITEGDISIEQGKYYLNIETPDGKYTVVGYPYRIIKKEEKYYEDFSGKYLEKDQILHIKNRSKWNSIICSLILSIPIILYVIFISYYFFLSL